MVFDHKNQLLIAAGNYGKEPYLSDEGKISNKYTGIFFWIFSHTFLFFVAKSLSKIYFMTLFFSRSFLSINLICLKFWITLWKFYLLSFKKLCIIANNYLQIVLINNTKQYLIIKRTFRVSQYVIFTKTRLVSHPLASNSY